jgi:hypothetical protein
MRLISEADYAIRLNVYQSQLTLGVHNDMELLWSVQCQTLREYNGQHRGVGNEPGWMNGGESPRDRGNTTADRVGHDNYLQVCQ